MYAAEWPCCHDPLRFSLGSDDLSPQRGNPTRRTPNDCLSRSPFFTPASRAPAARLPLGGVARTEHTHAAAHAWREGLCVSRTRPHALCVPHPFAFLFERLSPPVEAFHFQPLLAGVALSDFRRFSWSTRCEGLCVKPRPCHHRRTTLPGPHSCATCHQARRAAFAFQAECSTLSIPLSAAHCISANIFYSLPLLFRLLLSFSFFYFISPTVSKTPPLSFSQTGRLLLESLLPGILRNPRLMQKRFDRTPNRKKVKNNVMSEGSSGARGRAERVL